MKEKVFQHFVFFATVYSVTVYFQRPFKNGSIFKIIRCAKSVTMTTWYGIADVTMHRHWSGWRKKMSVRSQYPWFVCWAFSVCIRIINAAFLYDIWHFAFPSTPNKSQNQIKRILVTILLLFKWQTIVVQHTFIWTRQTGKVTALQQE